jgi:hypothetical protein
LRLTRSVPLSQLKRRHSRQSRDLAAVDPSQLVEKAKTVRHNLRSHIDYLRKQIKQADDDLDREVRNSSLWDKYEVLSSVPGVGLVLGVAQCSDQR